MKLIRKTREPLIFEKTAARNMLSDNPETYSSELLAFLYKEHPYLGRYRVDLDIKQQDDSRGYLYGVFMLSPANDVPTPIGEQRMGEMTAPPEAAPEEAQMMRVPVIVENKKAYSFDVFITPSGQFLPLSESRVAASMFDTNPFLLADTSAVAAGSSKGDATGGFGPAVPGGGNVGRSTPEAGLAKAASVLSHVTLPEEEVQSLLRTVSEDRSLMTAVKENESFSNALKRVVAATGALQDKVAHPVEDPGAAEAVVVQKVPKGYDLTLLTTRGFQKTKVANAEAGTFPLEVRQQAAGGKPVLVTEESSPLVEVPKLDDLQIITESGAYAVLNKQGSATRAAVLTDVRTFDGQATDMRLVVGPTGGSYQEKVAGIRCGDIDVNKVAGADPRGWGFFLHGDVAYEPVHVFFKVANAKTGVTTYKYEHPLKGAGELRLCKTAQALVPFADNKYLLPESARFVPFKDSESYGHDPVSMEKISSREDYYNRVTLTRVHTSPRLYSFAGSPIRCPTAVSEAQAVALLGAMGDSPKGAEEKLLSANVRPVKFVVRRAFKMLTDLDVDEGKPSNKVKKAAAAIRLSLVKEAAALPSGETVDSVLSLGFISPENINGYVDALPEFDVAVSKLSELLVGIRLGLTDVPESAVSSAIRGLERAIMGLKKLQLRQGAEAA